MSMLENSVCFDIETLPLVRTYTELENKDLVISWEKRCDIYYKDYIKEIDNVRMDIYQACWEKLAATIPEYSKIICISYAVYKDGEYVTKTLHDDSEHKTITQFFKVLSLASQRGYKLIGHNIKTFDVPFVIKRAIINGYSYTELPFYLKILFKKPWDLDYMIDTKELWNFGSFKFAGMLQEITSALGIGNSKDGEVTGEMIYDFVYNQDGDISKIYEYCEKDVITTMKIIEKFGL